MRRSAICGSRRSGSRWRTARRGCCRCWSWSPRTRGSSPAGCCRHARPQDLLLGSWELIAAARAGPAPADLGQRGWDRPRRAASPPGSPRSSGRWRPGWCSCGRMTRSPRAWSSARNGFFETSFMPGRSFTSPADFNAQFDRVADPIANARVVRTIKARPVDLLERRPGGDAGAAAGPARCCGWREQVRLGRDYYVRLDASDYSVDPTVIGRLVDVTADLRPGPSPPRGPRRRRPRPGLGPRRRRSPTPPIVATAALLRQQFRAAPPGRRRPTTPWSATWPTTTARSASTAASTGRSA